MYMRSFFLIQTRCFCDETKIVIIINLNMGEILEKKKKTVCSNIELLVRMLFYDSSTVLCSLASSSSYQWTIARGPSLFSFMNHSTNALFEGSFECLRGVCLRNPYLLNQERYVTTAVCMILRVGDLPKMK